MNNHQVCFFESIEMHPYFFCSGLSSPDYQHSPSNSHCSSNHNPPSIQSNPISGNILYDKISSSNNNGENSDHPRALLTSKQNLRSFTVPVAPPIIPPPPITTNKQPTHILPTTTQFQFMISFHFFIIL